MLISRLPVESWTQTALRDASATELAPPEQETTFGPWALVNYQLAALTDAVGWLQFVVARSNGSESFPEPTPTPRPGMDRPRRIQSDEGVAYLNELRARG